MEPIYAQIRERAIQIVVRFLPLAFYEDFPAANTLSRQFLGTDPLLVDLKQFVDQHLENDFGHGLEHAVKVALDSGALTIIEGRRRGYSEAFLARRLRLAQCAGLLHDIKRKEKEHAVKGAAFAREILGGFGLPPAEVEDVGIAIHNHEAFKDTVPLNTPEGLLISDCLYDADKFRWGPDNFTDTVWDMVSFAKIPLSKFVDYYPRGMEGLAKIKPTFRTPTGRQYGPDFIDKGLAIGVELYDIIRNEYLPRCRNSPGE